MTALDRSARHALVLGATGSYGAHVTTALLAKGWTIAAMARDPDAAAARAGRHMPIDWRRGDSLDPADVAAAARGARLIVHAVNPPAYRNWGGTVLPMLEATIAAAKAEGARILLPGSVYNYAPDRGASIGESAVQAPVTRKGRIRAAMEARLAAEASHGLKSLVIRAGDFFGPAAPNSALAWMILKLRGEPRVLLRPGPADVGHAFAYLPDLARATADLLEREADLAPFDTFHFGGHWLTPAHLLASVRHASGRATLPAIPFPWIVAQAAAPFDETMREMLEMRYLWRRPIGLANDKLTAFLGEEPHTPLDDAIRATLTDGEEARAASRSSDRGSFRWTGSVPAT